MNENKNAPEGELLTFDDMPSDNKMLFELTKAVLPHVLNNFSILSDNDVKKVRYEYEQLGFDFKNPFDIVVHSSIDLAQTALKKLKESFVKEEA